MRYTQSSTNNGVNPCVNHCVAQPAATTHLCQAAPCAAPIIAPAAAEGGSARRAIWPPRRCFFGACLLLILTAALLGPRQATLFAAGDGAAGAPVLDFGLTGAGQGWALTRCTLLITDDAGVTWRTAPPPGIAFGAPLAVAFADPAHGLAVQPAPGQPGAISVARTQDAGATWTQANGALLAPADPAAQVAGLALQLLDRDQGWLLLRRATSSNFSRGALFFTDDGGASWQRRSSPAGETFFFRDAAQGWAVGGDGVTLFQTTDGARTWAPVTLPAPGAAVRRVGLPVFAGDGRHALLPVVTVTPGGQARRWHVSADGGATWRPWTPPAGSAPEEALATWLWQRTPPANERLAPRTLPTTAAGSGRALFSAAATGWALGAGGRLLATADGGRTWQALAIPACEPPAARTGGTIPPPPPDLVAIGAGAAFDLCELPTPAELAVWRSASPYRIVNLYIGGRMRACANAGMNSARLAELAAAGWRFIPTWVGPQAPCTDFRVRFSLDATAAAAEGRAEAAQALATAQALGLTTAAGSGSVLYYDLEAFDATDPACVAAAQAFVQGWNAELHASGSLAGLYTTACWPGIGVYAAPPAPDAVWMAHWVRPSYDPAVTVWGIGCVDDTLWANHQRIRQYTGGHDETWGGVMFNIDANVVDGPVADLTAGAPVTTTVVLEEPVLDPADDGNLCSTAWHRYINQRGQPAYLTLNRHFGDPPPPIVNRAAWLPPLAVAGAYRVEVYLPAHPAVDWECPTTTLTADSSSARYTVHHAGGETVRVVDQMAVRDGWIDLGVYDFAADGSARLTLSDESDETQFTVTISVSAARFTLLPATEAPRLWLPLMQREVQRGRTTVGQAAAFGVLY